MQCIHCGGEVPDRAKVCGYCGSALQSQPIPSAAPPQAAVRRPPSPRSWLPWAVAGTAVIAAVVVAIVMLSGTDDGAPTTMVPGATGAPTTAPVPDVMGFTEAEARRALEDAGFTNISVVREWTDATPVGVVVWQDPQPGRIIELHIRIDLTVNEAAATTLDENGTMPPMLPEIPDGIVEVLGSRDELSPYPIFDDMTRPELWDTSNADVQWEDGALLIYDGAASRTGTISADNAALLRIQVGQDERSWYEVRLSAGERDTEGYRQWGVEGFGPEDLENVPPGSVPSDFAFGTVIWEGSELQSDALADTNALVASGRPIWLLLANHEDHWLIYVAAEGDEEDGVLYEMDLPWTETQWVLTIEAFSDPTQLDVGVLEVYVISPA